MIVRELITLMGYKVDKGSEKRAGRSIDGLKKAAGTLAALFATGVVAQGFKQLVGLGSDAAETMNVLSASFEDQTDAVLEWASTQAREVGRSEFQLRQYAGTLGAVLKPMTGSADAAAEMSTELASLTVDLASFFNLSESDVLLKLRAGITGEAEPLKQLGVVMNVASLDAFALAEGIGKTTKQMSIAEKTALRYRFILANTVDAQGDAAKTAGGYANLTKALDAALVDLGTNIGMVFLPAAEDSLKVMIALVREWSGPALRAARVFSTAIGATVRAIGDLIAGFLKLNTSIKVFAAVAVTAWAVASAPVLLMVALIAALGAAVLLIIDDLEKMGSGGESVIGGLIGEFLLLKEQTGSIFDAISGVIQNAINFWVELFTGAKFDIGEELNELGEVATTTFGKLADIAGRAGLFIGDVTAQAIPVNQLATSGVQVFNQIDTIVNAAPGMNEQQLAAETSGKTATGVDRLVRRTSSQLAVGN